MASITNEEMIPVICSQMIENTYSFPGSQTVILYYVYEGYNMVILQEPYKTMVKDISGFSDRYMKRGHVKCYLSKSLLDQFKLIKEMDDLTYKSVTQLREIQKQTIGKASELNIKATECIASKDFEQALGLIEEAVLLNPLEWIYRFTYAEVLQGLERITDAIDMTLPLFDIPESLSYTEVTNFEQYLDYLEKEIFELLRLVGEDERIQKANQKAREEIQKLSKSFDE